MAAMDPNGREATPPLESDEEDNRSFLDRLFWRSKSRKAPAPAPELPAPVPALLSPAEVQQRMREQAQSIDQILDERDLRDNYEDILAMRGDFEHLKFRPDITPEDTDWQQRREMYKNLVGASSIKEVLEVNFKEWQVLLLLPPMVNGSILEIQERNKVKYKQLLKTQLAGVLDNIHTKMAMVHFGLPVEALTLNNVLNADKDIDDPEDTPEEEARIQRIMYAEKPLEFLDLYMERSHGFPMLRRPKVSMRGGAESLSNDIPQLVRNFYLYAPDGSNRVETRQRTAQDFQAVALNILGIDPKSDWKIVVDQYHNGEQDQLTTKKPFFRSFEVNSKNYVKVWDDYLKARVTNPHGSWIMVVNHARDKGEKAPETYTFHPTSMTTTSKPPQRRPPVLRTPAPAPKIPLARPKAHIVAAKSSPTKLGTPKVSVTSTGEGIIKCISGVDSHKGLVFEEVTFSDRASEFAASIRRSLKLDNNNLFVVSFYSNQLDRDVKTSIPAKLFSHKITYPAGDGEHDYNYYVAPYLMGSDKDDWVAVATSDAADKITLAPQILWPPEAVLEAPESKQDEKPRAPPTKAPIWTTNGLGFYIEDSADSFLKEAFKQLNLHKRVYTGFSIDFYSNQLDRANDGPTRAFHHTIDLLMHGLKDYYNKYLASYIFSPSEDWHAVIRHTNSDPDFEPAPTFTPGAISGSSKGKGYLYGYAGKLLMENTFKSFAEAALDLLDISPNSIWSFTVDIFESGTQNLLESHEVTKIDHNLQFTDSILPHMETGNDWAVFVRHTSREQPESLEPHEKITSIVRLNLKDRGTAYWKVSNDKKNQLGINKAQDSFLRAMKVLHPARQGRVQAHVSVGGSYFGYTSMEVTDELWNKVQQDLRKATESLQYQVTHQTSSDKSGTFTIRLVGCEHEGSAQKTPYVDWVRVQKEIFSISTNYLDNDSKFLKTISFRLWKTAADREDNGPSVVIPYEPANVAINMLKAFLGPEPFAEECIWFRPEYLQFIIGDASHRKNGTVTWAAGSDPSLASFRNVLKSLFNDNKAESTDFFVLTVPKVAGGQKFMIDLETTEDQWRKHVFDYLHSNSLIANRDGNITADIDTTTPWGLKEPNPFPHRPASTTIQNRPRPRSRPPAPIHVAPASSSYNSPNTSGTSGNFQTAQSNPSNPPASPSNPPSPLGTAQAPIPKPMILPRFNKDRILKAQVARPVPQAYDPWILEQNRQDRLKRDSYWKDQSIIEPGQKPEPPIFGPAKELILSVGPNMPELYAQRLTPTDFMQLRDENQILRNMLLERKTLCNFCDATFAAYEKEKIKEHYKQHADQMQAGGLFCPLCGTKDWTFMDLNQRRAHLYVDQDKHERGIIQNFWDGQVCPICNEGLDHREAPEVLKHIASHTPDVLRYCDRCSRDCSLLSPAEVKYHDKVCTNAPIVGAAVMRTFCGDCGADRTTETDRQLRKHADQCNPGHLGYCEICGMNVALLDENAEFTHRKECRWPAGLPKTYCTRCGKDLLSMNRHEATSHKQECFMRDPRPQYNEEKERAIEASLQKERKMAAKNLYDRIDLDQREARLKALERQYTKSLGACPWGGDFKDKGVSLMLREELFKHLQEHANNLGSAVDLGNCPLDASEKLGPMSVTQLLGHFKDMHANNNKAAELKCTIKKADGTPCAESLNGSNLATHISSAHATPQRITDLKCPFKTQDGKLCHRDIPLAGLPAHVNGSHPSASFPPAARPPAGVTSDFKCPIKKGDGTRCRETINPRGLEAHLVNAHPAAKPVAASGTSSEITCPIHVTSHESCGQIIKIDGGGTELIEHIEFLHPEKITSQQFGVSTSFTCPLTTTSCGGMKIDVPTDELSADAFRRHYQHIVSIGPRSGTPPQTPAGLALSQIEASFAVQKARIDLEKGFKDNQQRFQDLIDGIAPGGDSGAMMHAFDSLMNRGAGGDPHGAGTGPEGVSNISSDALQGPPKYEFGPLLVPHGGHQTNVDAGKTNDDTNVQTGFDPSPTSPNFSRHSKKRKVGSDAHDARRRPGESTAGYIKRQKLAGSSNTMSRVPASAQEDDEEDEAYGRPSIKRDRGVRSAKKAKKHVRVTADDDAEQGSLGIASTPTTRRSARALSGAPGLVGEVEAPPSSMRKVAKSRKNGANVEESPAKKARKTPRKK